MKLELVWLRPKWVEIQLEKLRSFQGLQRFLRYSRAEFGGLLLRIVGLSLAVIGIFALIQSALGRFLVHDLNYLGMRGVELCGLREGRIACFMIHDRVSFAGALIAMGVLYVWLEQGPLKQGERWAWWTFVWAGIVGFGSFFTYLGNGYLDSWHGVASLCLLPPYLGGLCLTRRIQRETASHSPEVFSLRIQRQWNRLFVGRLLLVMTALGLVLGGITIALLGATRVFVPQDLRYLRLGAADLIAINRHLVPLIAHDRASFGGAVATVGVLLGACALFGQPSRNLWRAMAAAGGVGFMTAIGIHPIIGYMEFSHLAPAYTGALLFYGGIHLCHPPAGHPKPLGGRRLMRTSIFARWKSLNWGKAGTGWIKRRGFFLDVRR